LGFISLSVASRSSYRAVSRIGHRVIIRSPLGFCIYECIGCWNFPKGRAKNIRLLWGGGVFTMVPWAKILSDLNLVLTLHYRHCALASIASGGRYHSRSSRRCGRHRSCSSWLCWRLWSSLCEEASEGLLLRCFLPCSCELLPHSCII
jgi:hypothetical protein